MPSMPRAILDATLRLLADKRAIDHAIEQARAERAHQLGELTSPLDTATVGEQGPADVGRDRPGAC